MCEQVFCDWQTAEHVYTECKAKHWAEQSVCTSLDENAVTQFGSDTKMSKNEVP